jgi:hypothetical protein
MMSNIQQKNNEKEEHCKTGQKKLRILLRTYGCQMGSLFEDFGGIFGENTFLIS